MQPNRYIGAAGAGLRRLWARVRALELSVLIAVLVLAGALWGFLALADEVAEGGTGRFDRAILLALRNPQDPADPIGPRWFEEMARDVTALGSTVVLTLITLAAIGFLLMLRRRAAALLVAVSVGGGVLLSNLLKFGFARPRPELVPHAVKVYTASFPSGHSMLSAVTYLTLGALLARVQPRRRLKLYLLALAVLLTVLVGASRVYLGVHWPTDVLAGWCMGAAWAMLCWLAARWLQRRGEVAPDTPDAAGR